MNSEEEEVRLKELMSKLKKDLEYEKEEVSSKKIELEKIQTACNLFSSQLEETQYEVVMNFSPRTFFMDPNIFIIPFII